MVDTLNPKVARFFLSFLPQFIDPGRGPAWSQAIMCRWVSGSLFVGLGLVAARAHRS